MKSINPKWAVTRQAYPETGFVVEIVLGGLDYANPWALVAKYHGELEEFYDPTKAAQTAIEICNAWRKTTKVEGISVGTTGGFTMELDVHTHETVRSWATARSERTRKCDYCNDTVGDSAFVIDDDLYGGNSVFCSENCANLAYATCSNKDIED